MVGRNHSMSNEQQEALRASVAFANRLPKKYGRVALLKNNFGQLSCRVAYTKNNG